jgi:hypothetical protein
MPKYKECYAKAQLENIFKSAVTPPKVLENIFYDFVRFYKRTENEIDYI